MKKRKTILLNTQDENNLKSIKEKTGLHSDQETIRFAINQTMVGLKNERK